MLYRNTDMKNVIDEYIHNARHKELLQLRFCEGKTYEEIAEQVSYSPQHVKRICNDHKQLLMSLL